MNDGEFFLIKTSLLGNFFSPMLACPIDLKTAGCVSEFFRMTFHITRFFYKEPS